MSDVTLHDTVFAMPFLWQYRSCTLRGKPVTGPPVIASDGGQPLASEVPFPNQSVP